MLNNFIQRVTVFLCMVAAAALLFLLIMANNPTAFWHIGGEIHDAISSVLHAIGIGVEIVFFGAVIYFAIFGAIKLKHMSRVQAIGPDKYGQKQAVVVHERGGITRLEPLANTAIPLDAGQLMNALRQSMQANYQGVQTIARQQKELERLSEYEYVDEDEEEEERPALPAPKEQIPDVVRYSTIRDQIPDELSLLGIHPSDGNLEMVSPAQLKTAWFVGGSNTGKTNTVYGKVADVIGWGARLLINDSHAHKPDSLTNKLQDFHRWLIAQPAQRDEDIKRATMLFLSEFIQRRDYGRSCEEQWLIVTDEVNATGNHVVRLTPEEEEWLKEKFAIKATDNRIKLSVLFKTLAETCGYESRGFGMYGFFITQKVAGLSWLRNAMMTVFVHALLFESEALLAANGNRAMCQEVMNFKKGRTLVYGYEIEKPLILQQPLYESVKLDHPNEMSEQQEQEENVTLVTDNAFSGESSSNRAESHTEDLTESASEAGGNEGNTDQLVTTSFELRKVLLEIGRMKERGESNDTILRHYGLRPGGRNNQNLRSLVEAINEMPDAEEM